LAADLPDVRARGLSRELIVTEVLGLEALWVDVTQEVNGETELNEPKSFPKEAPTHPPSCTSSRGEKGKDWVGPPDEHTRLGVELFRRSVVIDIAGVGEQAWRVGKKSDIDQKLEIDVFALLR